MRSPEKNGTSITAQRAEWSRTIFSIDVRSLAIFRYGLAILSLVSIWDHARVWSTYHGPNGAVTKQALSESIGRGLSWSLFWISDSYICVVAILGLGICGSVALLVGWRTRLATVVVWTVITSLNYDAPLLLGGGDILLNLLLFWGLFLPLGGKWSIDVGRGFGLADDSIASAASTAVLLQMAIVYFFTGVAKWNETWFSGSAIEYVLQCDSIVRPLGRFLRDHAWSTKFLTHLTLIAELVIPFLLFSPWKNSLFRTLSLLLLFSFHIGIELTLRVSLFSWASLVGLLPFMPSTWWNHWPLRRIQLMFDRSFAAAETRGMTELGKLHGRRHRKAPLRPTESLGTTSLGTAAVQAVIALLVLYVVIYNSVVRFASEQTKSEWSLLQRPGELLALKQYWNMFSDPRYLCMDVACVARLRDGTRVDLLREGVEVKGSEERPATPAKFDTVRDMVVAMSLSFPKNIAFRPGYMEFMARRWEQSHPAESEKILENSLNYYPYGPHPSTATTPVIELFHLDRRARGAYLMGRRAGLWTIFHDNGVKGALGEYQNGLANGKWSFWDEQGRLTAEGMMENGRQVGEWRILRHDVPEEDVPDPK